MDSTSVWTMLGELFVSILIFIIVVIIMAIVFGVFGFVGAYMIKKGYDKAK